MKQWYALYVSRYSYKDISLSDNNKYIIST